MHPDHTIELFVAISALFIILGATITALIVRRSFHINHLQKEQHRLQNESRRMSIEEGERIMNEISREVHDNIGQAATLAKISQHKARRLNTNPQVADLLEDISVQIDTISLQVTHISHSLNHFHIRAMRLCELIQHDLDYMNSHRDITCDFVVSGSGILPAHLKLMIYRIAQQAFNNVLKHSGATEVNVVLEYGMKSFKMTIEDNGIGLSADKLANNNGIGLSNMRERATQMDGELSIISAPNNGCSIILSMPEVAFV